ncbi:MAG: YqiA/YcfP family alpha/beta fold hydrolase [Xenococcaceae cyanobacterium]
MTKSDYIYLHGFASSPQSTKAQYLRDRFSESQIPLKILDLNQGDFSHLTLTRQLQQVEAAFPSPQTPVTIIGSSFGGLTAAWLAQQYAQVQRLVLLAPAFGFLSHWLSSLGEAQVKQWQESGYLSIYHYGEKRSLPLHYQFVVDISHYQEQQLQQPVPTFILHGRYDDVIPIQSSRDYACQRPWVELIELESDHTLTNVMPEIWLAIQRFCQLNQSPFIK